MALLAWGSHGASPRASSDPRARWPAPSVVIGLRRSNLRRCGPLSTWPILHSPDASPLCARPWSAGWHQRWGGPSHIFATRLAPCEWAMSRRPGGRGWWAARPPLPTEACRSSLQVMSRWIHLSSSLSLIVIVQSLAYMLANIIMAWFNLWLLSTWVDQESAWFNWIHGPGALFSIAHLCINCSLKCVPRIQMILPIVCTLFH